MTDRKLLEELAKEPIKLPQSAIWEVTKRFGRDEAIAFVINVVGTGMMDVFVDSPMMTTLAGPISRRTRDVVVSTTGPVVEKAGFFPGHFKDAWAEYRSTPKSKRDGFSTYLKKAMRGGAKSLLEDILVHDPLYIGMTYAGITLAPMIPVPITAAASFGIAVGVVALGEVGFKELLYRNLIRSFKKNGFGSEQYLESRFLISKDQDRRELLEQVAKHFNLGEPAVWGYNDRYFKCELPDFNGRTPKMRLRKRVNDDGGAVQSAQIVYTKAGRIPSKKLSQFNFYPQKKHKLYFSLNQKMPEVIDDVVDERARRILRRAHDPETGYAVEFKRAYAHNPTTLFVSTDTVNGSDKRDFYILELKVRDDPELLKDAMKFVMRQFPVYQTTHGKLELSWMNEGSD